MKQNGIVCLPGPALLFFIFWFEYLISDPKIYRDFRETGPKIPDSTKMRIPLHSANVLLSLWSSIWWNIINGPGTLSPLYYIKDRGFNSFASDMIKLSVNETKWDSLLAWTRALILYILIWIFDFRPENLPGLSRNGPQDSRFHKNADSLT